MSNPSRRDRTRPAELLGLAAVLALVLGLVVLMSTRNLLFAAEVAAGGFIVALVVLATLLIAVTPKGPGDDGTPPSAH